MGKRIIKRERESATSLNIAILPSDEITQTAIQMSEQVGRAVRTRFTLNNTTFLPHITLYQAHVPDSNIELIKQELANLASRLEPFTVALHGFTMNYDTFLFWDCDKSRKLQQFHEETVARVNPHRNGLILPVLASVSGITE